MKQNDDMQNDIESTEIISPEAAAATAAVLDGFIKKLTEQEGEGEKPVSSPLKFRSGETVEDIVVEAIKPIIRQWMDDNLTHLVQGIVEKELQKLIPR